MLIIIVP
jgi:hypothetical protein